MYILPILKISYSGKTCVTYFPTLTPESQSNMPASLLVTQIKIPTTRVVKVDTDTCNIWKDSKPFQNYIIEAESNILGFDSGHPKTIPIVFSDTIRLDNLFRTC